MLTPDPDAMPFAALLPDRLRAAWHEVQAGRLAQDDWCALEADGLRAYREIWQSALLLEGERDLARSLIREIAAFTGLPTAEVEQRCKNAVESMAQDWTRQVDPGSAASVQRYYDAADAYVYDLMWWHALEHDTSPLGYVTALELARQHGCHSALDFGSGVGAGALLFGRDGLQVALADVSSALLGFSRWRLQQRGQPARFIDLKQDALPEGAFQMITAMDVFEHLADPVREVDRIERALAPGGILFGRFHADEDASHPQHIVHDFEPTFARLREHGLREIWRDGWLWGHQAFQKPL
jgi:2-polyprenyl-3-methyl-5-hydroxy-6-metoxy-1,4-benzoquinol methylase